AVLLAADTKPKPREESMSPGNFSEAHATLFSAPPSQEAGAATERVSRSLPHAAANPAARMARRNFIDEFIFAQIERDAIPHAPLATDYEFIRRVTLDLTGRIPSGAQVQEFVSSTEPGKRDKLIDRLLASEEFVDKWAYFFMDLFRANGKMGRGQN